jgi:hypothetical protein
MSFFRFYSLFYTKRCYNKSKFSLKNINVKKLLVAFFIITLLSAGCNSSQQDNVQTSTQSTQNSNTTSSEPLASLDEAVPIIRALQSDRVPSGQTYTFEDITFNAPWSDVPKQTVGTVTLKLQFANNKLVDVLQKESVPNELLTDFLGTNLQKGDQFKKLLGDDNFQSSYTFKKLFYSTTPETVAAAQEPAQNAEKALLYLKRTLLVKAPDDSNYIIYNFTTPYIKGFQFGSLASNKKIIEVYDNNNHSYTFIIKGTQAEADFILSSIKIK